MTHDLPRRPDWLDDAACLDHDPDMWDTNLGAANYPTRANRQALTICADCPVTTACLTEALHLERGTGSGMRFSIRGGLGPAERAALDTTPRRREWKTA